MRGEEIFHIGDYLDVLRRRALVVFVFLVVTFVCVGAATYYMEPIYRATVSLLIDIESPYVLSTAGGVEIGSQGYSSYHSYREYYRSQMEIITSRAIGEQVFSEFKLSTHKDFAESKDPVSAFLATISVEPIRDTRLLQLHVENKNPQLAAGIANRIAELYIQHNLSYISKSEWVNLLKNEYLKLKARHSEFSKIYKANHPEMVRLKKELTEIVENIAQSKRFDRETVAAEGIATESPSLGALEGLKANNVSIVDAARVPATPVRPNKLLNLLIAVVVGVFGGIGLAFFLEYQDITIKEAEDFEGVVPWPFLGKVPKITGRKKEFHVSLRHNDYISEAYRSVITRVLFADTEERPLKSIAISSLGPQEGKSTTTCNLAIALAQNGKRVLIVDADMRKPRLSAVFNVKAEGGLSSLLNKDAELDEVVRETGIDNLSFIGDSTPSFNPSELITSGNMDDFINLAEKKFDFVLFDTPPIGMLTDAAILSQKVDGTIIVVESAKTPKKLLLRNYKLLKGSNIRFVGIIIVKVQLTGSESYYYSSYSHTYRDST